MKKIYRTMVKGAPYWGVILILIAWQQSILEAKAQVTVSWLGVSGQDKTDWNDAANWSCCVPNENSHVVIPAGAPVYPIIKDGATSVKSLTITSKARLQMQGGWLTVDGDLINNGLFEQTDGTIELKGNIGQGKYANVIISGNSEQLLNGGDIYIGASLMMKNGILNTGKHKVIMGNNAVMLETVTSYVLGNMEATRQVGTATETFGDIGVSISATLAPGLTKVSRVTGIAAYEVPGVSAILRSYDIKPTINQNLNATLELSFLPHELNGNNVDQLLMFSSEDGGRRWKKKDYSARDTGARKVALTGVNSFSIWTLGNTKTMQVGITLPNFTTAARVYPNPFTDDGFVLTLPTTLSTDAHVLIYDLLGKMVDHLQISAGSASIQINPATVLPRGAYRVHILAQGYDQQLTLIKK